MINKIKTSTVLPWIYQICKCLMMQLCDHFTRRPLDRPGKLIAAISLICCLTVFVNMIKNRYAESSRQDRFRTYLHEMDALQPRMDHIEQHLYRDLDEMRRLHELLANKNSNPQSASPLVDGTAKNIKDIANAADSTVDRQYSDG